jgi:hypothetical protein
MSYSSNTTTTTTTTTTNAQVTFKPFKSQEKLLWVFQAINIQSWFQIHSRLTVKSGHNNYI